MPFPPRKKAFIPDPVLTKELLKSVEIKSPLLFVSLYIMYLTGIRPIALINLTWSQICKSESGPIIRVNYAGKYDKGSFTKFIPESAFDSFMKIKQKFGFKDADKIWPKSRTQLNNEMKSFTLKSNTFAIKCSTMRKAHANTIMQTGVAEVCRDALKHVSASTTMASYMPDDWRKIFTLESREEGEKPKIMDTPLSANELKKLSKKEKELRANVYENSKELEKRTYEFLQKTNLENIGSVKINKITRIRRRNETLFSKNLKSTFNDDRSFSKKKRLGIGNSIFE